jgi:hypothetical protein
LKTNSKNKSDLSLDEFKQLVKKAYTDSVNEFGITDSRYYQSEHDSTLSVEHRVNTIPNPTSFFSINSTRDVKL